MGLDETDTCKIVRPAVDEPQPCRTKYIIFFLLEYNRLNLVRHGSGTTYELRIKGKILIQLLESINLLCLVTKEQLKLETRRCNL